MVYGVQSRLELYNDCDILVQACRLTKTIRIALWDVWHEKFYLQHHPDISEFMNRLHTLTPDASQAALAAAWERHLYTYTICEPEDTATLSRH